MRSLPAVETLRRMWVQQFMVEEGTVLLRPSEDLPSAFGEQLLHFGVPSVSRGKDLQEARGSS